MNGSTKLWASVSGVCVTSAVVVGAVLGANSHPTPAKEQPAGQPVQVTTTTVVVTPSASPTTAAAVKVSPSVVKSAAPKRRTVVQQGAPVTDPTTSAPAQPAPDPSTSSPAPIVDHHGGPIGHGPTNAPSSSVDYGYPTDTKSP